MDKVKKTILSALQYFFASVFLMAALGSIIDPPDYTFGFFCFVLGLFLLPAFRSLLRDKISTFKFPVISSRKREIQNDLDAALEDGVLTDDEAKELEIKAEKLGVTEEYITKLRTKDFEGRVQPILDEIEQSRRFSPSQEQQLDEIAANLKIKGQYDEKFKIYRNLWSYENTSDFDFEPISAPIMLKKNEEAYFEAPCVWKQIKTVRNYKGYTGGSVGFRVVKGVNFRVGRAVPVYDEAEEMVPLSDGEIYVTNKRITFNGSRKSTNITTGRIVQLLMWQNGIEVRKTSGKPDFFEMHPVHAEYISALIHSIMN